MLALRNTVAPFLTLLALSSSLHGEDGFDAILESQTRSTFDRIAAYTKANPKAADADRAHHWLFATAVSNGLEVEAVELAEAYLEREAQDAATASGAQQVRMFGLAKSGKAEAAVEMYLGQLKFSRFQSGGPMIELGLDLATALRMAREFEGARTIYDAVGQKFFLNTSVQERCRNKAQKLDLLDADAPPLTGNDTKGEPIDLASMKGKVVLVDFWATNCPPCIEEFPNIKAIYSELHDDGFEIVGVSLDGDASLVESFTGQMKMPWRQIVDETTVEGLRKNWHVRTIPSLYIVDRSGKVSQCDVKGRDLQTTIEKLVKAK
ncbi:MAG: TlpA disulfide reductase family protein [Planctomycetota bacterium]|nr:TlpA disulfide reductase family protein [Planctomycetota bacterium]MDA1252403.1 TlpA disulfide reductase family protein [Planctomycetota bacterium]